VIPYFDISYPFPPFFPSYNIDIAIEDNTSELGSRCFERGDVLPFESGEVDADDSGIALIETSEDVDVFLLSEEAGDVGKEGVEERLFVLDDGELAIFDLFDFVSVVLVFVYFFVRLGVD
jgi:hypothetical protein